jgi:hypothetical protein
MCWLKRLVVSSVKRTPTEISTSAPSTAACVGLALAAPL